MTAIAISWRRGAAGSPSPTHGAARHRRGRLPSARRTPCSRAASRSARSRFAIGRFNADPHGDLLGTSSAFDPVGRPDDGRRRARLPRRRRRRPELDRVDGPWTIGPGVAAVAVGDFDEDGRPDVARRRTRRPGAANTVSVLLNTTPWPLLQFPSGDVARSGSWSGQHDQRPRDPERPERRRRRAARPADRVRRRRIRTTSSRRRHLHRGERPAAAASARSGVRFAPTVVGRRARRLFGCSTTRPPAPHVAFLSGVGTAATGGGGTGRRARPARPARNGTTGAAGPSGHGGRGRPRPDLRAPPERRARPGRAARPAVDATVRCRPRTTRSRQGARHLHGALRRARRALVGARAARPRRTPSTGPPAARVERGRVAIRVRAALAHAARPLPAAAHLRRPEGPGDHRLAAGRVAR